MIGHHGPDYPLLFLGAVLGLVFGSFLNVIIHRFPRGEAIGWSRSQCPHCHRLLSALDLIPVLSFLLLRGRCRHCREDISWRYPVVELGSAAMMVVILHIFGLGLAALFWAIFAWTTWGLVWTDIETQTLPDRLTIGLAVVGLIKALWLGVLLQSVLAATAGALILLMIQAIGYLIYRKPVLGWGDIKLEAAIGAYWGLIHTLTGLYVGFILGGVWALILVITKRKSRMSYMPFGPALLAGIWMALLWGHVFRELLLG
jgi:leader peptidase (prepilin peptidase)/N-methyltransferase